MIVYLDMDGVLANIHKKIGHDTNYSETPKKILEKNFYLNLEVMPGAHKFIRELLLIPNIDLFIASKITTKNLHSATEKFIWIERNFPELLNKTMLICDKTKLIGDYLIDDDLRWKNFTGTFIHFDPKSPHSSWKNTFKLIKV